MILGEAIGHNILRRPSDVVCSAQLWPGEAKTRPKKKKKMSEGTNTLDFRDGCSRQKQ